MAVAGCAWRMVDDWGEQGPAVGEVTRDACRCRPLFALQLGRRTELAYQTAGSTDPANAGTIALPIGQVESRPIAPATFSGHSRFGYMVGSSQLASAEDARDARRDPLWPELATDLLPWRSAGVRQPDDAARYLERACDADWAKSWWHHGDDRERNAAGPDQHQTQAAIGRNSSLLSENQATMTSQSAGR